MAGHRRASPSTTPSTPEASWSPDGNRIAFQSQRSGNFDVWVMDAFPGAAPSQVTFDPGPDTAPVWSPQGDQLALQGNHGGTNDLLHHPVG